MPTAFTVTVGDNADVKLFQKIVRIALQFGLEGVDYSDFALHPNRIFIGGYGYERRPFLRITKDIKKRLLEPELTWPELKNILRRNEKNAN